MKKLLIVLSYVFVVGTAFAQEVGSGEWSKKTFKIRGEWNIEQQEDGSHLLTLSDSFKTRNAPDLKLVLSPHSLESRENENALRDAVVVAPLKSNKGAQSYVIPAGTDLSTFSSLLIHCEKYTKLWGGTSLKN